MLASFAVRAGDAGRISSYVGEDLFAVFRRAAAAGVEESEKRFTVVFEVAAGGVVDRLRGRGRFRAGAAVELVAGGSQVEILLVILIALCYGVRTGAYGLGHKGFLRPGGERLFRHHAAEIFFHSQVVDHCQRAAVGDEFHLPAVIDAVNVYEGALLRDHHYAGRAVFALAGLAVYGKETVLDRYFRVRDFCEAAHIRSARLVVVGAGAVDVDGDGIHLAFYGDPYVLLLRYSRSRYREDDFGSDAAAGQEESGQSKRCK